ncbi:MAG TPA: hypothetical protein DCW90_02290 [Lachnospiraceae bacterium]|nr:hypothetical protein [Lachnospiraceae bacterium]
MATKKINDTTELDVLKEIAEGIGLIAKLMDENMYKAAHGIADINDRMSAIEDKIESIKINTDRIDENVHELDEVISDIQFCTCDGDEKTSEEEHSSVHGQMLKDDDEDECDDEDASADYEEALNNAMEGITNLLKEHGFTVDGGCIIDPHKGISCVRTAKSETSTEPDEDDAVYELTFSKNGKNKRVKTNSLDALIDHLQSMKK